LEDRERRLRTGMASRTRSEAIQKEGRGVSSRLKAINRYEPECHL
jgi:hypothetical protein